MARKKKSTKTANRNADVLVDNDKKLITGVTTSLGFIRTLKDKGATVRPEYPAESLRASLDSLDERNITFLSPNEVVVSAVNSKEPGPSDTVTITMDLNGGSYESEPIYPKTYPVGTSGDIVVNDFIEDLNNNRILYPNVEYPYIYGFNGLFTKDTNINAYELDFNSNADLYVAWDVLRNVTIDFNGGYYDDDVTQAGFYFNVNTDYTSIESTILNYIFDIPSFVRPNGKMFGFLTTEPDDPETRFTGDSIENIDTLYVYWIDEAFDESVLDFYSSPDGESIEVSLYTDDEQYIGTGHIIAVQGLARGRDNYIARAEGYREIMFTVYYGYDQAVSIEKI